ncbi:MAG: alcohol dehydrogenase catalytic domain-containing protein, partial [Armatimonadetes bacterium]|nr:alcohol dehydrogenase catalytic domain-containing protein [Armatimonadota bacterium]
MRAVVIQQPGTVSICDVAEPEVQPGWALVRPRLVGICGSDLHAYTGHSPLVAYPVTPGHEFVGEVIALGDELADPRWPAGRRPPQQILPGARVVADPSVPCGRCEPCRTGHYNTCENQRVLGVHLPGAMADLVLARVDCCLIVPDCLSDEIAALCEPLSIALNACDRTAVTRDDRVAILGAGPVGLACLLHCKLRGCRV